MLRSQPGAPRYCAVIASDADAVPRLTRALARAGWVLAGEGHPPDRISLVIHDIGRSVELPSDTLRFVIGNGPAPDLLSGDVQVTGHESDDALDSLFASWLPPGDDQLERMAAAFGRDAMIPLVEGLRQELRAALIALAAAGSCDAHKLAGLTGTIGFLDASQAWRKLDEAGDGTDVRRTTRTALVAIDRWLER